MNKKTIIIIDGSTISSITLQALFPEHKVLFAADFSEVCDYLLEYRSDIALVVFNCATLETEQWLFLIEKLIRFYPNVRKIAIAESKHDQAKLLPYALDRILTEHFLQQAAIEQLIVDILRD